MKVNQQFFTTWLDYPDNESLAVLIYFYGCSENCKNCQNKEYKNYNKGYEINNKNIDLFINEVKSFCIANKTNKIVFSGGDPLFNEFDELNFLLKELKKYDVCIYSGKDVEYTKDLRNFKFIKCGKFIEKYKQESIKTDTFIQFASKNQKLYNSGFELISDNGRYYFTEEKIYVQ